MLSRRGLITGLISLVAAPAIVRVSSLMPVKAVSPNIIIPEYWYDLNVWYPPLSLFYIKDGVIRKKSIEESNFYLDNLE